MIASVIQFPCNAARPVWEASARIKEDSARQGEVTRHTVSLDTPFHSTHRFTRHLPFSPSSGARIVFQSLFLAPIDFIQVKQHTLNTHTPSRWMDTCDDTLWHWSPLSPFVWPQRVFSFYLINASTFSLVERLWHTIVNWYTISVIAFNWNIRTDTSGRGIKTYDYWKMTTPSYRGQWVIRDSIWDEMRWDERIRGCVCVRECVCSRVTLST